MSSSLVVISGAIGAGKTAAAEALAVKIRSEGHSAAVLDLDEIYFMVGRRPRNDPNHWRTARRGAAALSDSFITSGIDYVIVEGSFWDQEERTEYSAHLARVDDLRFVTLLVGFDEALRRVTGDTSRTISRNPDFLRTSHNQFTAAFEALGHRDLVIDTTNLSTQQVVEAIVRDLSPLGR